MKTWYVKNLGDAMLANESVDRIKQIFSSCYLSSNSTNFPDKVAVFIRHESEHHLHCEAIVYLSPESNKVANKIKASKCIKPSPNDLHLLAGSPNSYKLLFSE